MVKQFLFLFIILTTVNCKQKQPEVEAYQSTPVQVELVTTKGIIVLELSNKTPKHRDNFIKIVKEGRLDSMLFHRVINDFVIQAGAYDSLKQPKLDSLDYLIPAEIDTALYHKRGALGAARTANLERASEPLSFYIVQRGPRADSLIDKDEKRINGWLQLHHFIHAEENKTWKDSLGLAEQKENWELYEHLQDTINALAKSFEFTPYRIPEAHRKAYRTLGGSPHLDQNYTIFGAVIRGMSVVDSIAGVGVNTSFRPMKNVYILNASVLDD